MKSKRWLLLLSLAFAGILLAACASSRQTSASMEMMSDKGMDNVESLPMSASRGVEAAPNDFSASVPDVSQRLVIRNANLDVVVDDPSKAADEIARLAKEMGGFVVSAEVSEREDSTGTRLLYGHITIRVPAEKFDDAVAQICQLAQRVDRKVITGQDVTEEYVDLKSRLRNLEATRDQLQRIMDDAVNTQDVLSVYRELTQVQGEIEQVKGRIKYLETSSAMSAISVDLTPAAAANPFTVGNWQPTGVAKEALLALMRTTRGIINVVIWLVLYILPTFFLLALLVLLVVWPLRWLWRWFYTTWLKKPLTAKSKAASSQDASKSPSRVPPPRDAQNKDKDAAS
ncbi:MAG: DUF4349 domain-containing protein [Chloroflexi bacterium]|nr:DUF4349 domain-containing protein [Chloroflexota bacterium]